MELGTSTLGRTRLDDQHPDIFPSSPGAVVACFVAALQARFYSPNGLLGDLPWVWDPDPTPVLDGGGSLSGDTTETRQAPRRLYVEKASTQFPDAHDVRPALLVKRGRIAYQRVGLGHVAYEDWPRGGQRLFCHAQVPISIDCLSRDDGECEVLADVVASFLIGSGDDLCRTFGLHGIEPPEIGETTIYRRQEASVEFWNTPVVALVEMRYSWHRWPIAPVLSAFVAELTTNGAPTELRDLLQRRTP